MPKIPREVTDVLPEPAATQDMVRRRFAPKRYTDATARRAERQEMFEHRRNERQMRRGR